MPARFKEASYRRGKSGKTRFNDSYMGISKTLEEYLESGEKGTREVILPKQEICRQNRRRVAEHQ